MVLKLQTHSIESWVAGGCVVVGTYGINKLVEYGLLPERYYCDNASARDVAVTDVESIGCMDTYLF